MLERHEIETFLTLAEELHFGRTAERLRVTTGRISHVVKKLERRIGAPLFERTSRVVRLTPIGRQLADDLTPAGGPDGRGRTQGRRRRSRRHRATAGGVPRRVDRAGAAQGRQPVHRTPPRLRGRRARGPAVQLPVEPARRLHRHPHRLVPVRRHGLRAGPAVGGPRTGGGRRRTHWPREKSVSLEVLADHPVVQYPTVTSAEFKRDRTPEHTPSGRPVPKGPTGNTFSEMLSLVAMGRGRPPGGRAQPAVLPPPRRRVRADPRRATDRTRTGLAGDQHDRAGTRVRAGRDGRQRTRAARLTLPQPSPRSAQLS